MNAPFYFGNLIPPSMLCRFSINRRNKSIAWTKWLEFLVMFPQKQHSCHTTIVHCLLLEAERQESIRDHKSYRNKPNAKRKKKPNKKISPSPKTGRRTPLRVWPKKLTQRKISPTTTLISPFIANQSVGGLMRIDEEKKIPANVKWRLSMGVALNFDKSAELMTQHTQPLWYLVIPLFSKPLNSFLDNR